MAIGQYIIDEHGDVVPEPDLYKWGEWLQRRAPVRVARTDLPNGITVSTIFLALDHGFSFTSANHVPLLFETMAYDRTPALMSFYDEQWRYPTWEAAAEGHLAAVEIFRRRYPRPRSLP